MTEGIGGTDRTNDNNGLTEAISREQAAALRTREQEIRTQLAGNPQAIAALDGFARNLDGYNLTAEQKLQALNTFAITPNPATAAFLEGRIAQDLGVVPATSSTLATPDAGTLTIGGQTYTVRDGALIGADGRAAGTVTNEGVVQINGETETRNVYSDLSARVRLQENINGTLTTLVDLHPADPRGRLGDANVNQEFAGRVRQTLEQTRREGMAMQMDLVFRTFAQQDALYAQGRNGDTRPRVTGARGGESWHNYGLGADVVFSTPNGQPSWPEDGNWTRYGRIAESYGLTWGGDWRNADRPHVEYHPGFGDGQAGQFVRDFRAGGLEPVWDRMGIGQRP